MSEEQMESTVETLQEKVSKWVNFVKLTGGMLVAFIAFTLTVGATYSRVVYDIQNSNKRIDEIENQRILERQAIEAKLGELRDKLSEVRAQSAQMNGKLDVIMQRVR